MCLGLGCVVSGLCILCTIPYITYILVSCGEKVDASALLCPTSGSGMGTFWSGFVPCVSLLLVLCGEPGDEFDMGIRLAG